MLEVDVETLGAVPAAVRYDRLASHRWRVSRTDESFEFEVDEYGLALDIDGRFRRRSQVGPERR